MLGETLSYTISRFTLCQKSFLSHFISPLKGEIKYFCGSTCILESLLTPLICFYWLA